MEFSRHTGFVGFHYKSSSSSSSSSVGWKVTLCHPIKLYQATPRSSEMEFH